MNRLTLPINEILVEERQRLNLGDIDGLASSLSLYGLIQPIVVSQDKRLIAGGRRLAAAKQLGWSSVDIVYKEALTPDVLHEMELEENVRRLDMSWQERALNIEQIHRLKRSRSVLEGDAWGQRETSELLGMSVGSVNYCLAVAKQLRADKASPLWQCATLADAWRLLMRQDEEAAAAQLALLSQQEGLGAYLDPVLTYEDANGTVKTDFDAEKEAARVRYLANTLNDPNGFEEYWLGRKKVLEERENTIVLSNRLHLCDSIKFMHEHPGQYDHIITDIPYGIDLDMLEQNNPHMGMNDIDLVEDEHQVEDNKELIKAFFPAAYAATRDKAFVVTWCDIMLWQFMYDEAVKAGFSVQRWPLTWVKTNACMNSAAGYNYTKNTEIAIVCRKQGATLITTSPTSVCHASNDEMKKLVGHPFAKPFECWRFIAEHVSMERQVILEPFAGRGSGVLSLLRLNRNVIGCEINVAHYNALVENVKAYYREKNPNYKFI